MKKPSKSIKKGYAEGGSVPRFARKAFDADTDGTKGPKKPLGGALGKVAEALRMPVVVKRDGFVHKDPSIPVGTMKTRSKTNTRR